MIPGVLTPPPVQAAPTHEQHRLLLRWVGIALIVVAAIGAVVWTAGYSPVGYQRFDAADGGRSLTFRQAGDYLVYEERAAGGNLRDGGLSVVVQDEDGAPVDVHDTEGRAIARFTLEEAGTYTVLVSGSAASDTTVAVAHARSATWLGTLAGLAALGLLPAAAGALALVLSRRPPEHDEAGEAARLDDADHLGD